MSSWTLTDFPPLQYKREWRPLLVTTDNRVIIHGGSYTNVPLEVLEDGEDEWREGGLEDLARADSTVVVVREGFFPECDMQM